MSRKKIKIEYQFNNASKNILWNSIGTPLGLSEWFADEVSVIGTQYIFRWNNIKQIANLIDSKANSFIRLQWEDDEDTDYYFELRINSLEISGQLALTINDFADEDEVKDTILLWDKQIDVLKRKTGI